ncbi:MAG: hypothetical protein HOP29_14060 [Phycisphaerales bacterium]|nr:hypothetical protein [Phycisphaerales bacterium]
MILYPLLVSLAITSTGHIATAGDCGVAERGALNASNSAILGTPGSPERLKFDWSLDNQGNWSGDAWPEGGNESVVLSTGAAGGGAYDAVATVHHEARHDNRLAWLTTGDGASPPSQTSTPTPHDPNGNLTGDGAYVYQYDAFNRLVEVRVAAGLPGAGGSRLGLLYDGLGRLAATRHDTVSPTRKTWHFYDGVRRIADWAAEFDGLEEAFVATATEREYVYGPDYVDEHVAQIVPGDPSATPSPIADEIVYTLQDANYNVVALLDAVGNVLRQYSWTPYGQLDASERCTPGPGGQGLASHPANHVGHQGLFWISFGADSVDPNGDLSDDLFPPLPSDYFRPDLNGLYYSRARFYSPHLGRFLTLDPNESALPLLTAAYMNGQTAMASLGLFNAEALYADGMNRFAAYGVNPLTNRDATGLSYNPYDDWVDEQIDYLNGHRLYALGMLNEGAKAASIGINLALDIAGSVLGIDTFKSIFKVTTGSGGFWDAMDIALSVTPFIGPLRGAVRAIGNASELAANARKVGRIGEELAGIVKNHRRLTSALNPISYRIPDYIDETRRVIGEVKNATRVDFTEQLRDYVAIAARDGYTVELVVRTGSTLSGPLQSAINSGQIVLKRILP